MCTTCTVFRKGYRDWLRFWAHLALIVLVIFTIASYFGDKVRWARMARMNVVFFFTILTCV